MAETEKRPLPTVAAYDGLRGIAIIMVIVHHAHILKGCPIGTEIFFVLSGYLITKSLGKDNLDTRVRQLALFYKKRCIRLLPPFFVLMFASVLIAIFVPEIDATIHRTLVAALTFTMNWHWALNTRSSDTLGHLWSLAAEQQFYLIWPPLFLLVPKTWIKSLLVLLFCSAVAWRASVWYNGAGIERLYFGFDTHADGLIAGCMLALCKLPERYNRLLSAGGVIALVCAVVSAALIPVETATASMISTTFMTPIAVLLVAAAPLRGLLSRAATLKPLRIVGGMSYSLYLWHLPVIALAKFPYSHGQTASKLVLIAVVSILAYQLIEKPSIAWMQKQRRSPRETQVANEPALVPAIA